MRVLGVILAGGLSRRMGRPDKGLMTIVGRPLLAWVTERARPQVDRLILNANGDPDRFAAFGLPVVADGLPAGEGPVAGLRAAFGTARGFSHVATFAGDTPLFPDDLVSRLGQALEGGADYAIAASRGREHPTFGLWPVARADRIAELFAQGVRAPRDLERHLRKAVVSFPADEVDPFFNANTPEDVAAVEALLRDRALR